MTFTFVKEKSNSQGI